jgi:hypothetical protein
VISDSRGLLGYFGSPVVKALPGGGFGYLPHRNRLTSDYLAAALPLGLQVRRCEEPRRPYPLIDPDAPPDTVPAGAPPDIWSLHSWCPAATNAAYHDNPAAIISGTSGFRPLPRSCNSEKSGIAPAWKVGGTGTGLPAAMFMLAFLG